MTAHSFSKSAVEKIEAAGGTVTRLREPVERKKKRQGRRPGRRGARGLRADEADEAAEPSETEEAREEARSNDVLLARECMAVPELRRRVLFTAMILAVYRLGSWIPAPGVNSQTIEDYFSGRGDTILGLLNLFSGGALSQFSLFALGIAPTSRPRSSSS